VTRVETSPGLAGVLFAIPAAAAVAVIVDELHQERIAQLQADTPVEDVDLGQSCLSRE
jgi:predicted PurR-regulated permease PerM